MGQLTAADFSTRSPPLSRPPSNPRLRVKLCYGVMGSWRDALMTTWEIGSLAGAVYTFVFYSPGVAGGLLINTIISCGVHGCWRRDAAIADLNGAVEELELVDDKLKKTADKTEIVVDKIQKAGTLVGADIRDLHLVDIRLDGAQKEAGREVSQLKRTNSDISATNAKLTEENQALRNTVEQLKGLIKTLNDHVSGFNSQNDHFKQNIQGLAKEITILGGHDEELDKILLKVDRELDQDVAELATQIARAQTTSREIFNLLKQQNKSLRDEIGKLQLAVAHLDKSDEELGHKASELQALEKQTEDTRRQLELLQKQYASVEKDLERAQREFTEERLKLEAIHRELDKDKNGLHQVQVDMSKAGDRLEKLGQQFNKTVQSLSVMEVSLQQQLQEVDKL